MKKLVIFERAKYLFQVANKNRFWYVPQVNNASNASSINSVNYSDISGVVLMCSLLTLDTFSISRIILIVNFRYSRPVDPVFLSFILSVHKIVKHTLKIFEQMLQEF